MHFKTDHWWISARQKHQHLHMINFFTRCRDKGSCPWTKQSYMGKCSKGKLRTSLWLMTEPSEVQLMLHQHSAMLITLKYLICLRFLWCCCFSPFVLTRKSFAESYKIMEASLGEIIFWFHFHLQLCKNVLEWLLSYEVTFFNL